MVPSSGHLFYAEDLAHPTLSDGDRHHADRVLRLRSGEELSVGDGRGSWRRCRWTDGGPEPSGPVVVEEPPAARLTVGFALVKGAKPELIVQKLCELGIDRIVPFVASRSVVRWDAARSARNDERLALTAREAGMQSRRAWLPELAPVRPFAEVVAACGDRRPVLADRGGRPLSIADRAVLIGPEGGWDDDERSVGLDSVSLSDQVLRSETAAIVAGALLSALRGGHFQHGG